MSDQPDIADERLDRLIYAMTAKPAPVDARERAIEKAVASHAWRQNENVEAAAGRFRLYEWRWAIAAMLLIAVGVALLLPTMERARMQRSPRMASKANAPQTASPQQDEQYGTAAYKARTVTAIVAQRAPVLIANGPATPLKLGEQASGRQSSGSLHVWNWSKSATSQIVSGVELWSTDHIALSPDGTTLVRADGTIHFLPGQRRPAELPEKIDLGGAEYHEGPSTYSRIGDMQFSPDGRRLALLVTLRNADHTVHDVIQVVEFPSGRKLCEFPAGEPYALRIAFSADGKQIAAGSVDRHVTLRDAATGAVIRQFEPGLKSQLLAVAISADGRHIAASARAGQTICFDASSAKITWQTDNDQLGRAPSSEGPEVLEFSPDSQFLAASCWGPLYVFDASSGKVVGTIKRQHAQAVHWSDDGKIITVVTPAIAAEEPGQPNSTIYPSVEQYNWRTGKLVDTPGN